MAEEPVPPRFAYTGSGYWGGAWCSYWVIMVITVLGGFFGVDHLYLRSPTTALLKFFLNIFTLGAWYVYDIIQIFRDKKEVLKNGLSIPILGASGIGAGIFKDEPGNAGIAKGSLRWMAFMLLFFIPFNLGLDRYIVGDNIGALIKFLCTFFPPIWILTIPWKFMEYYYVLIKPDTLFENGLYNFFVFEYFMGKWSPTKLSPKDPNFTGSFSSLGPVAQVTALLLKPVVDTAIAPLTAASDAASATFNTVSVAADSASTLMKATTGTAAPIISTTANIVKMAPAAVGALPLIANDVIQEVNKYSSPEKIAELSIKQGIVPNLKQSGGFIHDGGLDGISSAGLLLIVGLLLGGGVYYGGLRLKEFIKQNNNGSSARDDRPVEPR
jgi:hypothetical protein